MSRSPDLQPLRRALAACDIPADKIPMTINRLVRPPLSIGQSATVDQRISSDSEIQIGAAEGTGRIMLKGPDRNIAARMLRLNQGRPDAATTWKTLSRTERKQAGRLWKWTRSRHGLRVTQQGRLPKLDPALVLYCVRVLCEASNRKFGISRPAQGGPPRGPMLRALIEALPLAQIFLARRFGAPVVGRNQIESHVETIAEIVKTTRPRHFDHWSRKFLLGAGADAVSNGPATFRLAIAYARNSRSKKPQTVRPRPINRQT